MSRKIENSCCKRKIPKKMNSMVNISVGRTNIFSYLPHPPIPTSTPALVLKNAQIPHPQIKTDAKKG